MVYGVHVLTVKPPRAFWEEAVIVDAGKCEEYSRIGIDQGQEDIAAHPSCVYLTMKPGILLVLVQ